MGDTPQDQIGSNKTYDSDYAPYTQVDLELVKRGDLDFLSPRTKTEKEETKAGREVDESETTDENEGENGEELKSSLHMYPDFEPIKLFDYDDLDEKYVFVLLIDKPNASSLHVWMANQQHDTPKKLNGADDLYEHVKYSFIAKYKLEDKNLTFFREAPLQESDVFDSGFVNG